MAPEEFPGNGSSWQRRFERLFKPLRFPNKGAMPSGTTARPQHLWRLLGSSLDRKRRSSPPFTPTHFCWGQLTFQPRGKKTPFCSPQWVWFGFYYMLWFMQFQFIITSSSLKGYNNKLFFFSQLFMFSLVTLDVTRPLKCQKWLNCSFHPTSGERGMSPP